MELLRKMTAYKTIKKLLIMFLLLAIFLNDGESISNGPHLTNLLHDPYKNYIAFLKNTTLCPIDKQTSEYADYLRDYPSFERIYLHLLEHYLMNHKIDDAKQFFHELSREKACAQNAYWMLGKIYFIQDSAVAAFQSFKHALSAAGSPSIFLLNDFLDFDHAHQGRLNALGLIEELGLDPNKNAIVHAIYDCHDMAFERAIETVRTIPLDGTEGLFARHLMGYGYMQMLNYDEAEFTWRQGVQQARKIGDHQFEAHYLSSLGGLKRAQGKFQEAHSLLDSAQTIATSMNDWGRILFAHGNRGAVYHMQNEFNLAYAQYCRAVEIAVSIGAFNVAAHYLKGKAQALHSLGRYNEVLDAYTHSESYAKKTNNISLLFSLRQEKGQFYSKLNLHSLAGFEFTKAYEMVMDASFDKLDFRAMSRLADHLVKEKKYSEARKLYMRLMTITDDNVRPIDRVFCQWMLAETYFLDGRIDTAKQEFENANEMLASHKQDWYSEYLMAFILIRYGDIENEKKNFFKAIDHYNDNLIGRVSKKRSDIRVDRFFGLGIAYQGQGDLDKAIESYQRAIQSIENERETLLIDQFRIGYFSKFTTIYQSLIQCYFALYKKSGSRADLNHLYSTLEISRARALRDLILSDKSSSSRIKSNPSFVDYKNACSELVSIQNRLRFYPYLYDSLQPSHEIARHRLMGKRLRLIEDAGQKSNREAPSLGILSQRLNALNMGLLFYNVAENASFVLYVCGLNSKIIPLDVDPHSLSSLIDSLLTPLHCVTDITTNQVIFRADIAHQLYNALMKPIEEAIQLNRRLIVVPDMIMTGLPFEMLLSKRPDKSVYAPTDAPDYQDGFLLNRYEFLMSPSSLMPSKKKPAQISEPNVLVFANPIGLKSNPIDQEIEFSLRSNWRSDLLWFADKEAQSISKIHPNVKVFKRNHATQSALFQHIEDSQIIHFATHAFVDDTFDAFSGLVLATTPDTTDDGLLMGYEISDLHLDCDLVTLSACETGRGQIAAGEGVLGLPRLFLGAGANSVLMTLWKVDDRFTSLFMPKFYDYYLNENLTKIDALGKAKRSMFEFKDEKVHFQHPFFWASFALYGDTGVEGQTSNPMILYVLIFGGVYLSLVILYWAFKKWGKKNRRPMNEKNLFS